MGVCYHHVTAGFINIIRQWRSSKLGKKDTMNINVTSQLKANIQWCWAGPLRFIYQIRQRITFSPGAQHSRPGQLFHNEYNFFLLQQHPPVGGVFCVTTPRAKQARLMCGWVSRAILLLPLLPFSRLERKKEIRQPSEGESARDKLFSRRIYSLHT